MEIQPQHSNRSSLNKLLLESVLPFVEKKMPLRQASKQFKEVVEKAQLKKVSKQEELKDQKAAVVSDQFYSELRQVLLSRVGKKNLAGSLPQSLLPFKSSISYLKKQLVTKDEVPQIKSSIFDLPVEFFQSPFTSFYFKESKRSLTFHEYAKNRNNFEFIKEFNKLNGYQPYVQLLNPQTGDTFQVYKAFLLNLWMSDEADDSQNKFHYLAEMDTFSGDKYDFKDPVSLMRRQKALLEAIQTHEDQDSFDPMKVLRKGSAVEWMLILCHGGKFVLNVYRGKELVFSKTDKKYVARKKQGSRQINKDHCAKIMASVGSQMRRENEKILQEHIDQYMEEAAPYIKSCDLIFLHAPGLNRYIFLSESRPLQEVANKVRSIEFKSKQANFSEAKELAQKLTEVKWQFKPAAANTLGDS